MLIESLQQNEQSVKRIMAKRLSESAIRHTSSGCLNTVDVVTLSATFYAILLAEMNIHLRVQDSPSWKKFKRNVVKEMIKLAIQYGLPFCEEEALDLLKSIFKLLDIDEEEDNSTT